VQRQLPPSLEKQQLTTVGFFWVVTPFAVGAYCQKKRKKNIKPVEKQKPTINHTYSFSGKDQWWHSIVIALLTKKASRCAAYQKRIVNIEKKINVRRWW